MKNCIILIVNLIFLVSCNSHSKESIQVEYKMLDNGKYLEIEKINIEITNTGIITGHNYGTYNSFRYRFGIKADEIKWIGKRKQEPKNIVFCEDMLYLRYLEEEYKSIQIIDSLTQDTTYTSYYEVEEVFEKNVDQRYFFNKFGSQFWINSTVEEYNTAKQKCKEYDIPNDKKLKIGKVID